MGLGDVKMLAMIGAFLGWQQVWVVLLLASVTGAILGIALIAFGGAIISDPLALRDVPCDCRVRRVAVGQRLVAWYGPAALNRYESVRRLTKQVCFCAQPHL